MERLITISKKQHDAFNATIATIREQQRALELAGNIILMGLDEDLGKVGIKEAVCRDGVYSLAIELPDIAPAADTPEAASA